MRALIILFISLFLNRDTFFQKDNRASDQINTSVSFSVVGDLMCHSVQFKYAQVKEDSFNFNPVYSQIEKFLSKSDFTIGNLETVIAGNRYKYTGYPAFNSPEEYIKALADVGFDFLYTTNNHSLDRGEIGLKNTNEKIVINKMIPIGSFEKGKDTISIFEKNGIKFSLLAYTYGTNGFTLKDKSEFSLNYIDTNKIKKDIKIARSKQAEICIVYFHFGEEYSRKPSTFQKEIVKKSISYGADIILASHPHVLQPIEFFKNPSSKLDSGFVAYSLGNFFSNQKWRYSDAGMILNFELTKDQQTNKINLSKIDYIPTWVHKYSGVNKKEFIILPSNFKKFKYSETIQISKSDSLLIEQSYLDTKALIKKVEELSNYE
ncbi:MAG: CapA family protein [Melioribacteraceae bacterium]|nr:CapA family protein [Melioribacteraceae bacterium]